MNEREKARRDRAMEQWLANERLRVWPGFWPAYRIYRTRPDPLRPGRVYGRFTALHLALHFLSTGNR